MVKPTLNILKEEIDFLEPNKEYDNAAFCAKIALKYGRNIRSVYRALYDLGQAQIVDCRFDIFRTLKKTE